MRAAVCLDENRLQFAITMKQSKPLLLSVSETCTQAEATEEQSLAGPQGKQVQSIINFIEELGSQGLVGGTRALTKAWQCTVPGSGDEKQCNDTVKSSAAQW